MNRIYKTFWGAYIDLKRVVYVSTAMFLPNDNQYSNHKQVGFIVRFKGLDSDVVVYRRDLSWAGKIDCKTFENDEAVYKWHQESTYYEQIPKQDEAGEYVVIRNLQAQIDDLVGDQMRYWIEKKK